MDAPVKNALIIGAAAVSVIAELARVLVRFRGQPNRPGYKKD